ncbi:hypothetical protein VPH35_112388 [Triticum aestivum]
MGERFPGDGAAANGFSRRSLHEWEAYLLFEANAPASPDMRAPGWWRLSAGGIPIPPLPDVDVHPDYFADEIARVRVSLTEEQRALPHYAVGNHEASAAYFQHRQAQRLASTNGAPVVRRSKNSESRRLWWGAPGCTLLAVLQHLEGGNDSPLTYPPAPVPRRSGDQWMPRRTGSSSSSSRSSGSSMLLGVKAEPAETAETPLGRRTRNEGGRASSSAALPRFVKPETEPGLAVMKTEPGLADVKAEPGLDDAAALKWAREDWARAELERQRRALEQFFARRRGHDEGGVVVLDNDSGDAASAYAGPLGRTRPGVQQWRLRQGGEEGRRQQRRRRPRPSQRVFSL